MADAALLAPPAPSLIDLDATFLPVARMRQIARVTTVATESITGEVDVGPGHWVYAQHFPGDPIFPGTLMIEAAPAGAHQRRVSPPGEPSHVDTPAGCPGPQQA